MLIVKVMNDKTNLVSRSLLDVKRQKSHEIKSGIVSTTITRNWRKVGLSKRKTMLIPMKRQKE